MFNFDSVEDAELEGALRVASLFSVSQGLEVLARFALYGLNPDKDDIFYLSYDIKLIQVDLLFKYEWLSKRSRYFMECENRGYFSVVDLISMSDLIESVYVFGENIKKLGVN